MKNNPTQSKLLTATLSCLLVMSPFALAQTPAGQKDVGKDTTGANLSNKNDAPNEQENKKAIVKKQNEQKALLEKINQDIAGALKQVTHATKLIQEDKEKEALELLAEATGKFDIALTANPDLGLIPIDSTVESTFLNTSVDTVKVLIKTARKLLDDSEVQAARQLLLPLKDEVTTTIEYLPMQTYPGAIKLASKALVEGQKEEALILLSDALATIVIKTSAIPLSLIRVESMISRASKLEKESKKEEAIKLLDNAKEELQLAATLGYIGRDSADYDNFYSQIKALKKEIKGPNKVEKLYDELKQSLKALIGKKAEVKQTTLEKTEDNN